MLYLNLKNIIQAMEACMMRMEASMKGWMEARMGVMEARIEGFIIAR